MKINMTGEALARPNEMSLKANLAWDYFDMNNGGWIAVQVGDGAIIVTDESGDLENGFFCPDEDAFVWWLEEAADNHIQDDAEAFLESAGWISPYLLASGNEQIVLAIIGEIKRDAAERKNIT